jgi:putative oxidoreductase
MELSSDWIDGLILAGRCCLAVVFAVSALSKFRRPPAEIKILSGLHIPAPAAVEVLVGVCETLGVLALALGIYTRIGAILLAIFMVGISVAVLSFWSSVDPPLVRAQKLDAFAANIAIVGGLIYVIALGPGRFALRP